MLNRIARTFLLFLAASFLTAQVISAQAMDKKEVKNASDLPRFTYPVKGSASELAQADDATFNAFAAKVRADLDSVFRDYDIQDRATLRELLETKLSLQELAGEYKAGLETIKQIRSLEDKPSTKLTVDMSDEAWLQAAAETGSTNSAEFKHSFVNHFHAALEGLPWQVVQDDIRGKLRSSELQTKASTLGWVETQYDPAVRTSGALDDHQAAALIEARAFFTFLDSVKVEWRDTLRTYVASHNQSKPDIWEAREVSLAANQNLSPVIVAVWDSGIDEAIFGGRAFGDPHPTPSGSHGLAFDDKGNVSTSWLYPLTPEQQSAYPSILADMKGLEDLQDVIDSPQARALQRKFDTDSADQMHEFFENLKLFSFYAHGTHVAGIIAKGNPAVRLAVARFDDQLPDLPFPPTTEWAQSMAADFMQMSNYFRTRSVKVVNMSWGDDPQEFETWLSKTGGGADPAERKRKAAELYKIWYDGVASAIKSAPNTLFVCAAGNADSDASFLQDVPAGLKLPNMIVVGAVNQSGDETSFTSYGPTVAVDADGYEVLSYVPGGTKLKFSGTSMASPNVANLAAKLFALDPSLTPEQVIKLIKDGATASDDGRRHLIDPKRSVELLRTQNAKSARQ